MPASVNSTRQKLIQAALDLFTTQGINAPTRKIAERADVNEVTLFRNFGSKYGLLLAVFEDSESFRRIGELLVQGLPPSHEAKQLLRSYASECLHQMRQASHLICSIVGEAEHYPSENRRALGQGLAELNRQGSQYLAGLSDEPQVGGLNPEATVSLLHGLLLGYAMIEFIAEDHGLWQSQAEFLDRLVRLFLPDRIAAQDATPPTVSQPEPIVELPAAFVHEILRHTRKVGLRDHALAYLLFAAGLSADEVASLERSQHLSDTHQHVLRVGPQNRAVPVNQWVLGRRYGSYTANPLTKYLKNRKDSQSALILDAADQPITAAEVEELWQAWIQAQGTETVVPQWRLGQAQQTWLVDMLLRGMSIEHLSIISGLDAQQLKAYAQRAKEIGALEQAARLDQKSPRSTER